MLLHGWIHLGQQHKLTINNLKLTEKNGTCLIITLLLAFNVSFSLFGHVQFVRTMHLHNDQHNSEEFDIPENVTVLPLCLLLPFVSSRIPLVEYVDLDAKAAPMAVDADETRCVRRQRHHDGKS